jgi:hypothetical protein
MIIADQQGVQGVCRSGASLTATAVRGRGRSRLQPGHHGRQALKDLIFELRHYFLQVHVEIGGLNSDVRQQPVRSTL